MPGPVELVITNNNLPLLSQLDPLLRAHLKLAVNQIAEDASSSAVKAIQNQIAPDGKAWQALQAWWVAWKEAKGYSDQIYIMTSSYMQAITWKSEETSDNIVAVVGVMRGVYPSGGPAQSMSSKAFQWASGKTPIEIWSIAEILEYGWEQFNVRIPPRPLWRPLVEVKRRSAQTKIGIAIHQAIKKIEAQAQGKVGL